MDATHRLTRKWLGCVLIALPFISGCSGPQSTLDPAGVDAERIAELFWWMTGGSVVIWLLVIGFAVYATHINVGAHSSQSARWLIIGGGAIFPPVVLGGLLIFGLQMLPSLSPPGKSSLRIAVAGEQWWWRVHYYTEAGPPVALANEIRLPVGETVEFALTSPDVIHSFWIPPLGGKVDMIPGRTTRLTLQPTKVGTYRGACAEFCGTSHALMNFSVVVMEPDAFARWLEHQAAPAQPPRSPLARKGLEAFFDNGCSACHTIRGTIADGLLGPDLTHVGSRLTLGAGLLPNDADAFYSWISHPEALKPGVKMPAFGMLPEDQLAALATYLSGLK